MTKIEIKTLWGEIIFTHERFEDAIYDNPELLKGGAE